MIAAGGAKIGREGESEDVRIGANDPRNLLRKGTGEGYAEVEFVGVDGRTYRARWDARRARQSPSGRFQQTGMNLVAVESGEPVSGTKTEVLQGIEARLGLSFEQFRRSVLLAQGDFTAFLDAKDSERGSLLERITGTQIYTEISKKAFERAREKKQALKSLADQQAAIELFTETQREAIAAKIESLKAEAESLRKTEKTGREALAWFERLSALHEAEEKAKITADDAEAARVREVELGKQVDAVRRALPVRGKIESLDESAARFATAQTVLEAAREAVREAADRETAYRKELGTAEEAEQAAQDAQRTARPAIKQASELDTRLQTARSDLEKTSKAAASARQIADEAVEAAREAAQNANSIECERDDADKWLRAHDALRALAEEWGRWEEKLTQCRRAHATLARLDDGRGDLTSAEEQTRHSLAKLTVQIKEARDRLESARSDHQRLQKSVAREPMADLRDEGKRATSRANALQKLLDIAKQVPSYVKAAEREQLAEERAVANADAAARALESTTEVLKQLKPELKQAQRAVERTVAAAEANDLRGALEPGRPCPVCGSEEHPWVKKVPAFSKLAHDEKRRVEELNTRIAAADRKTTEAKKEIQEQRARVGEARGRQAEARTQLRALARQWKRVHRSAEAKEIPADPRADGVAARVEAILGDAQGALNGIEERLSEAARLQDAATQASQVASEQQDRVDALEADHKDAGKAHRAAKEALEDGERGIRVLRETLTEAKDALAEPLEEWPGWTKQLEQDPDEFAEECAAQALGWNSHQKTFEANAKKLSDLRPRVEATRAQAWERQQKASDLDAEQSAAAKNEARLIGERKQLLGGRPADQVEHELQAKIEAARRRTQAARGVTQAAASTSATARAEANVAGSALKDRQTERGRTRKALDLALDKLGCDEKTLRELLEHDEAWVGKQQTHLDKIRQEEGTARAVLKERFEQRTTHERSNRPVGTEEHVKKLAQVVGQKLPETQAQLVEEQGKLKADDSQRKQFADLGKHIEEQEKQAEVWKSLGDLIGSADGNRFRVFAQSLTLEILLRHANGRLRELTPRYSLERAPGAALTLQIVDHDMGDEVRGTKSLSGGESFLVSLALALGLATLSSKRTQVESLFVDEGFGALDADSLETVVSALDALHATGRQVGVISHVSTVAERVGARVIVEAQGAGRSRVRVETA